MTNTLFALLVGATVLAITSGCNSLIYRPGQGKPVAAVDPQEDWGVGAGPVQNPDIGDRRWTPVYFSYDQSNIGETEREKLAKIYDYLARNEEFDLLVEGHCDERGSEEYNRTLGERRAIAVIDYLVALGMPKSRLHSLSFGEERPVQTGLSEENFRLNRRAELVVISAKRAASLEK